MPLAFLTWASQAIPVDGSTFSEKEPEWLGTEDRADDGSLRSSVRGKKRVWGGATPPLAWDDAETVLALAPPGTFVACGGAFLVGPVSLAATTVLCSVRVTEIPYRDDRSAPAAPSFKRVLAFTMREA